MASPANKINSDPFPEDCAVLVRYPLPPRRRRARRWHCVVGKVSQMPGLIGLCCCGTSKGGPR
jgi:hypothetical protein